MRDIIWFSLLNGNPGCFFWNARGSEVAEFKLANEVASKVNWTTFERKKPSFAVVVPHPLDDDGWFRTQAGKDAYAIMGKYSRHCMDKAIDFDFTMQKPGDYQKSATVDRFDPLPDSPTDFSVSAGYQLKSLVRADNSEALLYLRNVAGVKLWEQEKPRHWKMYLRQRHSARLKVTLRLPGKFRAEVCDLDTAEQLRLPISSGDSLDLGVSEHDFVIRLKR